MKYANDAEVKNKSVENIKAILKGTNPEPQKMGLELFHA